MKVVVVWFRKGLRLHDNPALVKAVNIWKSSPASYAILPVFCLDPFFAEKARVGIRRWQFLLETLDDLDAGLRKLDSKLLVLRGRPMELFRKLFKTQRISHLIFEEDTEPYARQRDAEVSLLASKSNVEVISCLGHTLYSPKEIVRLNGGSAPMRYQGLLSLLSKLGPVPDPLDAPSVLPKIPFEVMQDAFHEEQFDLFQTMPTIRELKKDGEFKQLEELPTPHKGGETVALARMESYLKQTSKVIKFEKPKTSPAAFEPADTTVLSPYLKFGSLSVRLFYHRLKQIIDKAGSSASQPPVSLLGQIYWREFYYSAGYAVQNYGKMEGNPICLQVAWKCSNSADEEDGKALLEAWTHARTGFPWIDAIMTQLRQEGWIHHLARHSVACFLTRGDLYVSWERGVEVFDELLLDADWSLNVGNWLWLSASAFFYQYFRIYSPISFGKQYDKQGKYIRKYIPALKQMPDKYIYEPWTAPLSVQQAAGCIIGKDYPKPIVDHDTMRKQCMEAMKNAYAEKKYGKLETVAEKRRRE